MSSLALHHVKDVPAFFELLVKVIKPGGFIAVADLAAEDGSFHGGAQKSRQIGMYHFGFDPEALAQTATQAGLVDVQVRTVSIVERADRDRRYRVFCSA